MITIEQLNAIPGRPSFLPKWRIVNLRPCCLFADKSRLGEHGPVSITIGDSARICPPEPPIGTRVRNFPRDTWTGAELLEFAVYVRRVEIEIERLSHEEMFLRGSTVYPRHDAIDYAVGDADDDEDEIDVSIIPTSRLYPGDCVDLDMLGNHIVEQCSGSEDINYPDIRWKEGASEALSVFLDTYADLDPWYISEAEESVSVRLIRSEDGHAVDWKEVK